MRRHNMALYSSCSNISWESNSILFEQQTRSIESRFDIRCNQEFLNMRKRKLLEKLVETRATYESVKNQILANITNNADDKRHNPDEQAEGMDDAGTGTNVVKRIVDLIDTGFVESRSVMHMESCIGLRNHSEKYKGTSSKNETNQSGITMNDYKKKRVVNTKAKRIRYGPSSNTTLKPVNENIHAKDLAENDIQAKYSVSILNRYIYMNDEDTFVTGMIGSTTFMNVANDANLDTTLQIKHNQIKNRSQRKLDVHMPQQIRTNVNIDAFREYNCSRHRLRHNISKTITDSTPSGICYDLQNGRRNIEKSHHKFEFINELHKDSKHMSIALSRGKNKTELKDCSSIKFSTKDLNIHFLCMLKLQSQNKLPHDILSSISTNSAVSRKLSDLIKQVQSKSYDMFLKTNCVKIDSNVEPVHQSVSMLSIITFGPKEEQANGVVHKLKQASVVKTPHIAQSFIPIKSNAIVIEQAKLKNKCSRLASANDENIGNKNDLMKNPTDSSKDVKINNEKAVIMYNNHVFKHKKHRNSSPSKIHLNKHMSKSPGNVNGWVSPSSFKLREISELCRMSRCSRSVWKNKSLIDTNSAYTTDSQYVDTVQTNNYYSHDYDVCYNFLYGPNYTGPCDCPHQIEVSGKKKTSKQRKLEKKYQSSNDSKTSYPKPDKRQHHISPHFFNNSCYALNLQSITNTPYKLKSYECEPGVCVPYECDPLECDKRIKHRLNKHKTVQSSQSCDNKSISTGRPRLEGRAKKIQAYQGKSRQSRQDSTRKCAECKSISHRSCVRFGSDLSLNVEFYKDSLSPSEGSSKPPRKSQTLSVKGTMSKEKKLNKDTGIQRKVYNRESQVETHTASKGTGGVGKLLQRCFCTRQLHKHNNVTKPRKRGSNAASQCSISPKKKKHEEFKANKEDTTSVGTINKHKFKVESKHKLEPGECEPGVCVPNECDPMECEKRMKRRLNTHKTVQSSPSCDEKSINTCSMKSKACARKSQAHLKTKGYPTRPSKACKPRCPRKITECENVPRKSFRFGSNISLNVDFYMEHPTINADLSRQQKRRVSKTKSTAHKGKKKVNRNSTMTSAGHHRESQVEVQTASKGTGGLGKLLQRCFCTRQLYKQNYVTKPIKPGNNAASQCSVSPKKHRQDEYKTNKEYTITVGTTTKPKYKPEAKYKLEPGECEPGVCVPYECDPIEYKERIKRRLNTHKTVQSSPSSDVKSINTCSTTTGACARKTQAHLKTQSYPSRPSKTCKSKCPRKNTESEKVSRKSFRFGSDISLNVDFFMEHPSITADVSNRKSSVPKIKSMAIKQHKKVHRDSTMKSKTRHRESQIETETATKGTGVGKFLQRCFCTLKLRKQSKEIKQERGKNVKSRGSNTQNRHKRSDPKEAKKDTCGDDCKSVGTVTKRKYKPELKLKLEPGECEPGVCVPNECDPYKCLERMRHRFKDSKMTCTDKLVSKSAFTTQTRSVPDAKSTYTEEHKKKLKKGTMSKIRHRAYDSVHPSRQSVHLGSNFSFGIDFYKETAAIGDQLSKAYNNTGKSCDRIQCKKTRKTKSYGAGTDRINTKHSESQAVVDNSNKGTGMGELLRRCFCTLKLKKSEPKPLLKQKQIKQLKREQPLKKMISEGTRTPNKVRFQGPVVTHKLAPYECEPNICVPGQCDPHECDKLIKRRNKQTKSISTDFEKSKKCSYCNTTSSKLGAKKIQSDISRKSSKKLKDSPSPESGTSVVRYGSSLRINIEFYKENGYPQSFAELKKHHRPSEAASEMSQKKKEYQKRNIRMRNKSSGGTECGVKCNKISQAQPPRRDTQSSAISMLQRCFCTLKLKNYNAQQKKSNNPPLKAREHKSMGENVCNMETIMPYSKKKFKKYTSETKLHQHDSIKPSYNKELHNKVSETALGSKSRAVGDLIRKCTCLIRENYRSSRFKRKQGIDIKVKPKREKIIKHKAEKGDEIKANRKEKDKVEDSSHQTNKKHIGDGQNPPKEIKGTKTLKLQKRPENCSQEPKFDNNNSELCDKCGKHKHKSKKEIGDIEVGDKHKIKHKKDKGENDVDTKIKKKLKPVRETKSLKAVSFGKPLVKPTKSERQSDKKAYDPDLCDHCGKQKRKQKTKYSRIDQGEQDIALTGETEVKPIHNSKDPPKRKTRGVKRKQSPATLCQHCNDQLTAEQLNRTNLNSKGTELTSEYNVNLKTDDLENHDGVPCRQCHHSSAIIRKMSSKKDGKKTIAEKNSVKKAKSKILDKDPKKVINDLKEKISPLFDNCSGSVDKCVKKFTTIPVVRKFRDAVKCVREIINKDYTEGDKSKPVDSEGATIKQTEKEAEKAILELRIDQGGMCILNSSDIQNMMLDAQDKFRRSQKEKNKPESKKKKIVEKKKPKQIKKEKKLQTQKEQGDEEYVRKDHKCNICCECQRANRERYKNILCRKKRLNKHLVCCEEPSPQGTWDDEPEQDDLMFKPDFSVYVDTYSKSIVNDLDFRQNTAGTGCPICDAGQAKKDPDFPIPPVEILIDRKSLSIKNLPKARLKMREAVNNMQKLKATRRKEKIKSAIVCTCSSTCKEGLTKKTPKPKKVQKVQKKTSPCPCGDVCKGPRPGVKLNEGKKKSDKQKGKGKGKEKGKDKDKGKKNKKEKAKVLEQRAKEREKIKLHKKLQNEKKNKIKKKIEMKHRQQVQAKYKKEDTKRRRARLKSDKRAMKNIKKVDNDFALVADSVFDVLTLGSRTVAGSARCAERELLDLKGTVEKIKKFKHNPQLAVQQMQSTFSESPVQSTCQRIRYRCARMKCTQAFISKMEECACTNYLIHSCDKDPKKRLKHKKKKDKRERVPLDFECSLYMGQLRKKTWLCIYYMCPWFYPHWRAIVEGFKQFTDMLLFLLAVLVWSPCIAAFELFRTFICCVVCTK